MPVPAWLQDQAMKWIVRRGRTAGLCRCHRRRLQARRGRARRPYFIRSLDDPRDRREARADILDTPVLPGSIVKTVALVAALERGIITANSSHMCRRVVEGRRPDVRRARIPISSGRCRRLKRSRIPATIFSCRSRRGCRARRSMPRAWPRACRRSRPTRRWRRRSSGSPVRRRRRARSIDVMARLAGAGKDKPVPMKSRDEGGVARGSARRRGIRHRVGVQGGRVSPRWRRQERS